MQVMSPKLQIASAGSWGDNRFHYKTRIYFTGPYKISHAASPQRVPGSKKRLRLLPEAGMT